MIQHNDSDTSCMRALALLERTLASVPELSPNIATCHPVLHGPYVARPSVSTCLVVPYAPS